MLSPGQAGVKSTANTAAMVAGNPWLAAVQPLMSALQGGPSNAVGTAVSGGAPITLGPVVLGYGSGTANTDATGSSRGDAQGSSVASQSQPNPTSPGMAQSTPIGVPGFGGVGGWQAPPQNAVAGFDPMMLAVIAGGFFLLTRLNKQ